MSYKKMENVNILGIKLTKIDRQTVLSTIEQYLKGNKQHQIITPNPEILLLTQNDEEFFYILNRASLSIPDGFGLKLAGWLMFKNLSRYAGSNLTQDILKLAEEKKYKVAIVNWTRGLSSEEDIEFALANYYPDLKYIVQNASRQWQNFNPTKINEFAPDIVFATLGAPWQEKFIYHNLEKIKSAKIGLGVGGSFDFITCKAKRAPYILQLIGLEWFWRLIWQPTRINRIINAVIGFSYEFFRWRFVKPFKYRPNVVCLVYKKENDKYKILLVERQTEEEHWQLPQGGTGSQSAEEAGLRELSEELGTNKFKPIAVFNNVHKYEFGERVSKYGDKIKFMTGYKGQKQSLLIAEFTGGDEDIRLNFWDHKGWRWVEAKNMAQEVHTIRKESAQIFMDKFWDCVKSHKIS